MGRGSDDRPLTLERPMPLRVASTEGLARVAARLDGGTWLPEGLARRPNDTPPVWHALCGPTVPSNETADDLVTLLPDNQPLSMKAVINARPDLRVLPLLGQSNSLAVGKRENLRF